jgi:hypothetical protein
VAGGNAKKFGRLTLSVAVNQEHPSPHIRKAVGNIHGCRGFADTALGHCDGNLPHKQSFLLLYNRIIILFFFFFKGSLSVDSIAGFELGRDQAAQREASGIASQRAQAF